MTFFIYSSFRNILHVFLFFISFQTDNSLGHFVNMSWTSNTLHFSWCLLLTFFKSVIVQIVEKINIQIMCLHYRIYLCTSLYFVNVISIDRMLECWKNECGICDLRFEVWNVFNVFVSPMLKCSVWYILHKRCSKYLLNTFVHSWVDYCYYSSPRCFIYIVILYILQNYLSKKHKRAVIQKVQKAPFRKRCVQLILGNVVLMPPGVVSIYYTATTLPIEHCAQLHSVSDPGDIAAAISPQSVVRFKSWHSIRKSEKQRHDPKMADLGAGSLLQGDPAVNDQEKELNERLKRLYPAVNEEETPLPRSWSPKDKYSYIGLSQNNLRVHYKGTAAQPLALMRSNWHTLGLDVPPESPCF